jgi:hypothetical protein
MTVSLMSSRSSRGTSGAHALVLLAAAGAGLTALAGSAAHAQGIIGTPQQNHVVSCTLDTTTYNNLVTLLNPITNPPFNPGQVGFIVIYTLNDNDGQKLSGSGPARYTGPVVCTSPGVSMAATLGTTDIPNSTDQPGATSIDVLNTEEAFLLRYKINQGSLTNTIEKRFCHTVANNSDCFRVFVP